MKDSVNDLPDRSEVTAFDHTKLKHVETTEKNVLPDKSSMQLNISLFVFELKIYFWTHLLLFRGVFLFILNRKYMINLQCMDSARKDLKCTLRHEYVISNLATFRRVSRIFAES